MYINIDQKKPIYGLNYFFISLNGDVDNQHGTVAMEILYDAKDLGRDKVEFNDRTIYAGNKDDFYKSYPRIDAKYIEAEGGT